MNERIKALAKQHYLQDRHTENGWELFPHYEFDESELEKFAELIVRECLDIVDGEGCGEGGSIRAMEKIKEHFGVEE